MNQIFNDAMEIASTYDVSTPENGLVLYSVSFLPTKENRDKAFEYVRNHPRSVTIENTLCGAKLVEMDLSNKDSNLSNDDIALIWATASKRMIEKAKGEIIAFVKNADPRSVFCRIELDNILKNDFITTINGEEKHSFAAKFTITRLHTSCIIK